MSNRNANVIWTLPAVGTNNLRDAPVKQELVVRRCA
jgi:hypothetical protein